MNKRDPTFRRISFISYASFEDFFSSKISAALCAISSFSSLLDRILTTKLPTPKTADSVVKIAFLFTLILLMIFVSFLLFHKSVCFLRVFVDCSITIYRISVTCVRKKKKREWPYCLKYFYLRLEGNIVLNWWSNPVLSLIIALVNFANPISILTASHQFCLRMLYTLHILFPSVLGFQLRNSLVFLT